MSKQHFSDLQHGMKMTCTGKILPRWHLSLWAH